MNNKRIDQDRLAVTPAVVERQVTKVSQRNKRGYVTSDSIQSKLNWNVRDLQSGRFRTMLHRFITENVPAVSACVWTWVRLASAPGRFHVVDTNASGTELSERRLEQLTNRLYRTETGHQAGLTSFTASLFTNLFRDGLFSGFVTVQPDGSGVDRFIPVDSLNLKRTDEHGRPRLMLETENSLVDLDRHDFYCVPLNGSVSEPFGRSIVHAIPFVTRIEQQLVDDMQRSSHNAGYHRLHVKVSPPERLAGESDQAYVSRINSYFDSTVSMIKSCDIDENPVTWDNVAIEHVGPDASRAVTNSWFFNHRAMIEEICAGTNLAPFLLGYSYGATATWSGLKYEMVMRQVRSVQDEVATFLEWIAQIDLALAGLSGRPVFEFDNSMAHQAVDEVAVESKRIDNLTRLLEAGVIDMDTARAKAKELL